MEALTEELARIHTYPHGGYPTLERAVAEYAGVAPDTVVLGAGADDLIMLLTRSSAGPGDRVAIANDPTYPMFSIAVWVAGAEVGDEDPALTICCRPNNPTGKLGELPVARPLVVDEAYFEFSGVSAVDLIEDDVAVIRTFSKAFGLAGARVGYALAGRDAAAELRRRQHPAPLSTLSAALALAALASPPDFRRQPTSSMSPWLSRRSLPTGCCTAGSPFARSAAASASRFATSTTTTGCSQLFSRSRRPSPDRRSAAGSCRLRALCAPAPTRTSRDRGARPTRSL